MFDSFFLRILSMSAGASIVIGAVLILRLIWRRWPKTACYALWLVVLFRLLCPIELTAPWGIQAPLEIDNYTLLHQDVTFSSAATAAARAIGDAANGGLGTQFIETADGGTVSSLWWEVWVLFGKYLWALGAAALLVYGVVSWLRLRRRLVGALRLRDNIWQADGIDTPFVMGLFRPRIYLPSGLPETDYILLHEQHHIRRGDHLWRLLAWAALCLHWFNPLVWLAFLLSGRDMELSCDEAVMRRMDGDIRADYAAALLRLSTGHRSLPGMPLAFGESDPKRRIKNVLSWRKPALWVSITAAVLAIAAAVLWSFNASGRVTTLGGANYTATQVLYDPSGGELTALNEQEGWPVWCISADYQLYVREQAYEGWEHVGTLEPYPLTREELLSYTADQHWTSSYRLREITDAYILRVEEDFFYLAMQTENGHTLLACGWEDVSERGQGASDDTRLSWMFRLESFKEQGQPGAGLMARSLTMQLGEEVGTFASYQSDKWPGLFIEGFESGPDAASQKGPHLGYAVFETYENGGFKLLSWYRGENAAVTNAGIHFCTEPLVIDGVAYQVVLCDNEDLGQITWTDSSGKARSMTVYNRHAMEIFSPGDTDFQFWSKSGALIDCHSVS